MSFVGCFACGSKDIEFHESAGHAACVSCGVVQEENAIVSSIEFQEQGDRSHVVGQFISANCTKPFAGTTRGRYGGSRESREATLANAKRVIAQVATSLRLPHYFVDRSFRLYQLALQHNFLFGRRQSHIVATCLYIVCRQEKSPYLLIDFADALQCNVYLLGKNYLQFIRLLGLNLPVIDPALYIHRFAIRLEFNEKMNAVVLTALRMIARFKKDWINVGRRPDGICAAAMLIASRAHGFFKGQLEVAKLFRVSADTVKRRLIDFKSTPAAQLTLEQFRLVGDSYNVENDPPSFVHNQYNDAEKARQAAAAAGEGGDSSSSSNLPANGTETYAATVGEFAVDVPIFTSYNGARSKTQGALDRDDARATLYEEIHSSLVEACEANAASKLSASNKASGAVTSGGGGSDLLDAYSALQELTAGHEIPEELRGNPKTGNERKAKFVIKGSTGPAGDTKLPSSSSGNGDSGDGIGEDLYLINSDELDAFILTTEEQEKRSIIWERTYRTFLNERERRRKPNESDAPAEEEEDAISRAAREASFGIGGAAMAAAANAKPNKRKRVSISQDVVSNSSSYVNNIISNMNNNTAPTAGSRKINYNAMNSAFEKTPLVPPKVSAVAVRTVSSSAAVKTAASTQASSSASSPSSSFSSSAPTLATMPAMNKTKPGRAGKFAPSSVTVASASGAVASSSSTSGPAARRGRAGSVSSSGTETAAATTVTTEAPATAKGKITATGKTASKISLPKTGNKSFRGGDVTAAAGGMTAPDASGEYDFVSEAMGSGTGGDNDGDD